MYISISPTKSLHMFFIVATFFGSIVELLLTMHSSVSMSGPPGGENKKKSNFPQTAAKMPIRSRLKCETFKYFHTRHTYMAQNSVVWVRQFSSRQQVVALHDCLLAFNLKSFARIYTFFLMRIFSWHLKYSYVVVFKEKFLRSVARFMVKRVDEAFTICWQLTSVMWS